jgi:hypothetical protein
MLSLMIVLAATSHPSTEPLPADVSFLTAPAVMVVVAETDTEFTTDDVYLDDGVVVHHRVATTTVRTTHVSMDADGEAQCLSIEGVVLRRGQVAVVAVGPHPGSSMMRPNLMWNGACEVHRGTVRIVDVGLTAEEVFAEILTDRLRTPFTPQDVAVAEVVQP